MRTQITLLTLLASLTASGCQQIECADGTIERDGKCEPPDLVPDVALCGPFTELVGDRCVPMFPPTECDPSSTEAQTDPETGVTTCIGMGGPTGCGGSLACPKPTGATKQTVCGQLYDFITNEKFAGANPEGSRCDPANPAASGPCSVTIQAFNASTFTTNPTPLDVGDLYIDDCGRYRAKDIEVGGASIAVALGVDDIAAANRGPMGVTVTAAVAVSREPLTATNNLEMFVANIAPVSQWSTDAKTNLLQTGIYAQVFRAGRAGSARQFENQAGVSATGPAPGPNSFYFAAAQTTRQTVDDQATVTGANGTALITNATLGPTYSGVGGITDTANCTWEGKQGASVMGVLLVQVLRKTSILGKTCTE